MAVIINIDTIGKKEIGYLSFFEMLKDFPYEIKRIYYIHHAPEGMIRGFHAHKKLKQILFCPYGEIELVLDNGFCEEKILLDSPSKAIIINEPTWREIKWMTKDSVLCVAASDYYDEEDYIRNYKDFKEYINRSS